jgi:uncharacterized protein YndB with AHSA1/START domain
MLPLSPWMRTLRAIADAQPLDILEQRYTIIRKQQASTQSPRRGAPLGSETSFSLFLRGPAEKYGSAMPKVHVSTVINAPIERVWRTVSDFNGLPSWMPGMKDSTIEDGKPATQVGVVRRLSMTGTSDKLRERLEAYSPQDYRITYSVLEGPLPVKKIVTTMHLRPITDTYGTLAEWSSQFETEPGKEEEGAQFMTRVFGAGFRQLKKHLGV